jgi:hypothetical protein
MRITTRLATTADRLLMYSLYKEAMKGYIERIWGWDEPWQKNDFENALKSASSYIVESNSNFAGYFQDQHGRKAFLRQKRLDRYRRR